MSASQANAQPVEPRCSFCGRSRWDAGSLIESPAHIGDSQSYICLKCTEVCRSELIRQTGQFLLNYEHVIWLSGVAGALFYAIGCQLPAIWPLLRNSLPEAIGRPWLVVLAVAMVGAALGLALSSILAPAPWLQTHRGQQWMKLFATTASPGAFRCRVAGFAALPILLTVIVVGNAFFFR